MAVGRVGVLIFLSILLASATALSGASPDHDTTDLPSTLQQGTASPSLPAHDLDRQRFPLPDALRDNVAFWTAIFSEYSSQQAVLHDERHLGVLYAVLDFSQLEASDLSDIKKELRRKKAVRKTEQHYGSILLALASGKAPDDEDHRRVKALLRDLPGGASKYRAARERLRTQTGLKDQFAEAIERSGRYLAAMEASFEEHGVPKVLTRMAFVESMFQEGARSKVGAGGIWQLMPATARSYLSIGPEVDERYDPLTAADAAARILRDNFRSLESWPLAITAYNHGASGMRRAVRSLGTRDPGVVLTRYKSRTFGFASRNFYAEFLAAANIYAQREQHFPHARPAPALRYDTFKPSLYVSALDLARQSGVPLEDLRKLNPAFVREIWRGGLLVPKGYELRVPEGTGRRIAEAYASLPDNRKSPYQAGRRHRVRSGETLSGIARRYGTTVAALQRANKLRRANHIRIGQTLFIPARPGSYRPPPPKAVVAQTSDGAPEANPGPVAEVTHVVQSGETLSTIAQRYGTRTGTLVALNRLANSHRIAVGQKLRIPAAGIARHTVRPGETLSKIARIYGTTVRALKEANRIVGHVIYPRQVLVIP